MKQHLEPPAKRRRLLNLMSKFSLIDNQTLYHMNYIFTSKLGTLPTNVFKSILSFQQMGFRSIMHCYRPACHYCLLVLFACIPLYMCVLQDRAVAFAGERLQDKRDGVGLPQVHAPCTTFLHWGNSQPSRPT